MKKFAEIRRDLRVLIWLLRSGRTGAEVLDVAVELVLGVVDLCFVVLDREAAERMIRSEMVSLLEGVATGRIDASDDARFLSYLLNRYRSRLVPNLLAAGAITEREDLSPPEEMEAEEFLDWLSMQHQNCWEVKETGKKRRVGGVKSKNCAKRASNPANSKILPGLPYMRTKT